MRLKILNSVFFFFKTNCNTNVKELSLTYLLATAGRLVGFIPFPKGISATLNTNSLHQELNSGCLVHLS